MSYTDTTPNPPPSRGEKAALALAGALADGARIVIPAVSALVALAVIAYAWLAVAELFALLGADVLSQILAGAASVGVLIALAGVLALATNRRVRALAAIYAIAWLPLVVALVGLASALRSELIAVPDALTTSGRVIAGLLAGLAMLPVVTLAVAGRRSDDDDERGAMSGYVSNALKGVLLAATAGASLSFGTRAGVPLEVAIFVSVLLEASFVLAMLRVNRGALHAGALLTFGAALGLVSIETLSVLSGLNALAGLARVGEALYLAVPALALGYVALAALTDRRRDGATGGEVMEAEAVRVARPSALRRLAERIRSTRDGLADLRAALGDGTTERVPVTLARDTEGAGAPIPKSARKPKSARF